MSHRPTFVLAVPDGIDPEPLRRAVLAHHTGAVVAAVGVGVEDGLPPAPLAIGWERLSFALDAEQLAFLAAIEHARRLLDSSTDEVVVLQAGAAIVTAPLDSLLGHPGDIVLIDRVATPFDDDGREPSFAELLAAGRSSTVALRCTANGRTALDDLVRLLVAHADVHTGRLLDLLAIDHDVVWTSAPDLAVGEWKAPDGPIALIDAHGHDIDRPWVVRGDNHRPRTRLSRHVDLRELLSMSAEQLGGVAIETPRLGSRHLTNAYRLLTRDALRATVTATSTSVDPFPAPSTDPDGFTAWLDEPVGPLSRFWSAVYDTRPDVRVRFPDVRIGHLDGFDAWSERWRVEEYVDPLVPRFDVTGYELKESKVESGGVNVIGYLDRTSGIGMEAARLATSLELAGVPVSRISLGDSSNPLSDIPVGLDQRLRYDTNLIVVTAEQLHRLPSQLREDPFTGRRTIGYWFWELSTPSPAAVDALSIVDEVWAPSEFVRASFATIDPTKVRLAPLTAPTIPAFPPRTRMELGLPTDRFVFLCTFDMNSVIERKNPIGAIDAFRAAFEPEEGPVLVIKTINGDRRGDSFDRLLIASEGRPDIIVRDGALSRADQLGLIAAADVLVSLHRSEGYGLHLTEAMALGTPVLTTAYSGPLDFLDRSCAELVPYRLVPVEDPEGAYTAGEWADPDLASAARSMRRLFSNDDLRERLASAARERMSRLPGMYTAGLRLRAMLEEPLRSSSTDPSTRASID